MKLVVLSAMVVALASPAFAADSLEQMYSGGDEPNPLSGSIEASIGTMEVSSGSGSASATIVNVSGALNYRFDERWNGQVDAGFNSLEAAGTARAYGTALHVFWRDPAAYAVGAFGSFDLLDISTYPADVNSYKVGPEAQIYRGNVTYYGQAFYGQYKVDGVPAVDTWGARGEVRYFHTENLRFEAEAGFTQIDGGGTNVTLFTAGLGVERRFDNSPFSIFGRYLYDHATEGGYSGDGHTFLVGLRASFGNKTLFEEDRNGATMEAPEVSRFF